jgi:adenylate kinase family enzyme
MTFPVFKTKTAGVAEKFDLNDPKSRKKYFEAKAGNEIKKLQKYLQKGAFVGFLLGKKNSGKGTYSKLFMEAVGAEHIGHLAVGDIVRDIHKSLEDEKEKQSLVDFLKNNYRGFHSVEETLDLIGGRSQSTLISSELILALIKYEISKRPRQAVFIDGFPRAHDQINYSLYLKELIGYPKEPDFFVFLNVPNSIIDERIKYRVVCPICKTPRNTKLLATKDVGYDSATKQFYLMCDTPSCNKERMLPKEGDELGIEPIRARLEVDNQIFQKLLTLTGVPKVYLRNSVPVDEAAEKVDDYELTPSYSYKLDEATGKITTLESPWIVKDDEGKDSYSLLPPAVVVGMIKQIAGVLGL